MGRLQKGQSLLLSRLEKGGTVFPPVPPPKQKTCGANSQSKPLPQTKKPGGKIEGGDDTLHFRIGFVQNACVNVLAYNLLWKILL